VCNYGAECCRRAAFEQFFGGTFGKNRQAFWVFIKRRHDFGFGGKRHFFRLGPFLAAIVDVLALRELRDDRIKVSLQAQQRVAEVQVSSSFPSTVFSIRRVLPSMWWIFHTLPARVSLAVVSSDIQRAKPFDDLLDFKV